ncbi:hypothetical protein E3E42_03140 [Thermococcus sp. JdF3]|nr:hypothetical protein [Thermococcus sp. JdF3]
MCRFMRATAIIEYPRNAPTVNARPTLRTFLSSVRAIIERRNTIMRNIEGRRALRIPRAIIENVTPVNSVTWLRESSGISAAVIRIASETCMATT